MSRNFARGRLVPYPDKRPHFINIFRPTKPWCLPKNSNKSQPSEQCIYIQWAGLEYKKVLVCQKWGNIGIRKCACTSIMSQNLTNIGIYRNFPKILENTGDQQKLWNYRKYRKSEHPAVYIQRLINITLLLLISVIVSQSFEAMCLFVVLKLVFHGTNFLAKQQREIG